MTPPETLRNWRVPGFSAFLLLLAPLAPQICPALPTPSSLHPLPPFPRALGPPALLPPFTPSPLSSVQRPQSRPTDSSALCPSLASLCLPLPSTPYQQQTEVSFGQSARRQQEHGNKGLNCIMGLEGVGEIGRASCRERVSSPV